MRPKTRRRTEPASAKTVAVDDVRRRIEYRRPHKEGRDIVEAPALDFTRTQVALEEARQLFRTLNRSLRAVAHEVTVDFTDEH